MNVCKCSHSWLYHKEYDDSLQNYVTSGCDHYSGCECKLWEEKRNESQGQYPTPIP